MVAIGETFSFSLNSEKTKISCRDNFEFSLFQAQSNNWPILKVKETISFNPRLISYFHQVVYINIKCDSKQVLLYYYKIYIKRMFAIIFGWLECCYLVAKQQILRSLSICLGILFVLSRCMSSNNIQFGIDNLFLSFLSLSS
jgi:hypothetical protein